MGEARAEFFILATDRLVADDDIAFEQQFFNMTQTELKLEIPPNRVANYRHREPVAVINQFVMFITQFHRSVPSWSVQCSPRLSVSDTAN